MAHSFGPSDNRRVFVSDDNRRLYFVVDYQAYIAFNLAIRHKQNGIGVQRYNQQSVPAAGGKSAA